MSKDYAFPQHFISAALKSAQPTRPTRGATPFALSTGLLGDLAALFERESSHAESKEERSRLYMISRELDRMWRVKTAKVRGRP